MSESESVTETHPAPPTAAGRLKALTASFLVVTLLAAAGGLAALIYLALVNRDLIEEVRATNHRLIDCTTPGGDCYKQSQARTGAAIVGINEGTLRVIVAALSCQADGVTGERALAQCTTRRATSR